MQKVRERRSRGFPHCGERRQENGEEGEQEGEDRARARRQESKNSLYTAQPMFIRDYSHTEAI